MERTWHRCRHPGDRMIRGWRRTVGGGRTRTDTPRFDSTAIGDLRPMIDETRAGARHVPRRTRAKTAPWSQTSVTRATVRSRRDGESPEASRSRRDSRRTPEGSLMTDGAVSVVIPTFNMAAHLPALWASMRSSGLVGRVVEIIVVDDGSTDGTATAAEGFIADVQDPVTHVRLLRLPSNQGRFRARLAGARVAQS